MMRLVADAERGEDGRRDALVGHEHEARRDDGLQELGVQSSVEVSGAEVSQQVEEGSGQARASRQPDVTLRAVLKGAQAKV